MKDAAKWKSIDDRKWKDSVLWGSRECSGRDRKDTAKMAVSLWVRGLLELASLSFVGRSRWSWRFVCSKVQRSAANPKSKCTSASGGI